MIRHVIRWTCRAVWLNLGSQQGECELVTMACVSLAVEGMMCQRNCGTTVQNALLGVSGVSRAEVSHADK